MSKRARLEYRRSAAAAAVRQRERERGRRQSWAAGAVGLIFVVIAVLVVVRLAGGAPAAAQQSTDPQASQVIAAVTSVSAAVLDQVAAGKVDGLPKVLSGEPPLTADGKPLVLYVGAEYCPFCAAQRWGMVVALSRFGSFTDLGTTHSSGLDTYPNTATLSFHGASYASDYLAFQGVETNSNVRSGAGYAELDRLTPDQSVTFGKYGAPPYVDTAGAIPFIDFGNRFVVSGASVSPELLAGQSGLDIAEALSDPDSPIAQAVDGAANAFTAAICVLTDAQPRNVCSSPAVTIYSGTIHG